jgi:crotonobetainyl-CoA:carnitine CoA-transferase CaiB-like acyl-CoA transferase
MIARPFSEDPGTLKVLDLGIMIGAPFVATMLGDLGAEVIKIEKPGIGDLIRHQGEGGPGLSYRWQVDGRNKRSVTLDLRKPEGQAIVRRLAEWADVLVENNRPGTLARYGLGYEDLRAINPRLVYVSVSGYGQTGPYRDRPGYDFSGAAFGGLTYGTGFPDRPPVLPGLALVDYNAALFAVIGALDALRRRDAAGAQGRGDYVDVALYEPIMRLHSHLIPMAAATGLNPAREGSFPLEGWDKSQPVSDRNAHGYAYETRDGHYISCFAVTDEQFARLAEMVGEPSLVCEANATMNQRVDNAVAIDRPIRAWFLTVDRAEAMDKLIAADVPSSPINSPTDLLAEPHLRERGNFIEVENALGAMVTMQDVVPRRSENPGAVRWAGEPLGASNRDVLQELLGLSEEEFKRLQADRII